MTSLGSSPVNSANQILQPVSGGANPPNAHFTNAFGSVVGGVTGCGGAGGSAAALAGKPGYNVAAKQHGGKSHRRGGYKRHCTCRGKCHCKKSNKRRCKKSNKSRCKRSNKRTMRGGLSAFSPASFSGANPPYQHYMSNIPASNNFSAGSSTPLPLNLMGTATPVPITAFPNCTTK